MVPRDPGHHPHHETLSSTAPPAVSHIRRDTRLPLARSGHGLADGTLPHTVIINRWWHSPGGTEAGQAGIIWPPGHDDPTNDTSGCSAVDDKNKYRRAKDKRDLVDGAPFKGID